MRHAKTKGLRTDWRGGRAANHHAQFSRVLHLLRFNSSSLKQIGEKRRFAKNVVLARLWNRRVSNCCKLGCSSGKRPQSEREISPISGEFLRGYPPGGAGGNAKG
jgi:hypothetical protein